MLVPGPNFRLLQGQEAWALPTSEGISGETGQGCTHPPTPFLSVCSLITSQRSQTEDPRAHSAPLADVLGLAAQCFGKLLLSCQH